MNRVAVVRSVIVDDSVQARKLLRLMLNEIAPEVQILGEASHLAEGVQMIREHQPDVVFLDIEMPGKSGLHILEELPRDEIHYEIVFTTAYDEFALRAFRLAAVDYLLKPINESHLAEAIEKIRISLSAKPVEDERLSSLKDNLEQDAIASICVPTSNGFVRIPLGTILYFEADGSYVNIFTDNGKSRTISKNLKYIEQAIGMHPGFVRVHRSYLVNISQVAEYSRAGRGTIRMKNGHEIDLARDRKETFLKRFGR